LKKNIDLIRITKKLKKINTEIKDKNDNQLKKVLNENKPSNNLISNSSSNYKVGNPKKTFDINNFNKINDSLHTNPNFITIRYSVRLLQSIINLYSTYIDNFENAE